MVCRRRRGWREEAFPSLFGRLFNEARGEGKEFSAGTIPTVPRPCLLALDLSILGKGWTWTLH